MFLTSTNTSKANHRFTVTGTVHLLISSPCSFDAALSEKGLTVHLLCFSCFPFPTFLFCAYYWRECSATHSLRPFLTSAKLVFFALLQVVVFEEHETDGKIQFTSSPDYGMTVDVQWGQEVRGGGGGWGSSWGGHDWGKLRLLVPGPVAPNSDTSMKRTFCVLWDKHSSDPD